MAGMYTSGSGKVGEASLGNYGKLSLNQVFCVYPGTDNEDKPLPNIEAFDDLTKYIKDDRALESLVQWIEPQTTCAYIMRHHGATGLKRVLFGLARACSKKKIHMGRRVAIFAQSLGLEVL